MILLSIRSASVALIFLACSIATLYPLLTPIANVIGFLLWSWAFILVVSMFMIADKAYLKKLILTTPRMPFAIRLFQMVCVFGGLIPLVASGHQILATIIGLSVGSTMKVYSDARTELAFKRPEPTDAVALSRLTH